MQAFEELRDMVKTGSISRDEAIRVVSAVQSELRTQHELVEHHEMDKTAGIGKSILTALATSAALTAGGLGVNFAAGAVEDWKLGRKHEESFKQMFRTNPDLASVPKSKAAEFFSIFKTMSPTMATNPHLAGNFVERQAASFGGVGFEEAGQLARAEQAVSAGKSPSVARQLGESMVQQGVGSLSTNLNQIARNKIENQMYDPSAMGERRAREDIASKQTMSNAGYIGGRSQEELLRENYAKALGKQVSTGTIDINQMRDLMKKQGSAKSFSSGLLAGL